MIDKKKLDQLLAQLNDADQKSVVDYAQFLVFKHSRSKDIEAFYNNLPEIDEPLSDEEKRQLQDNSEWVEWDEFERTLSEGH